MYSRVDFFKDVHSNLIKEGNPERYAVFICIKCKNEFRDADKIVTCNTCKGVVYCSSECKTQDWPYHRKRCGNDKRQCGYVMGAEFDH